MAFTWDTAQGRYRDANGRLVSDAVIRAALDQVLDAQTATTRDLTQQLIDGTISLAVWQWHVMQQIKSVHLIGTAAAIGGWAQMDAEWFGWAGSQLKTQYAFLRNFAAEFVSGAQPLNGTMLVRISLYVGAGRATNRDAVRRLAAQRAAGDERSNLGRADHCRQCIDEAKKGWVPFGTLIAVGKRTCLSNCRCWLTFRVTPAQAA